jgi:hypothetical protein
MNMYLRRSLVKEALICWLKDGILGMLPRILPLTALMMGAFANSIYSQPIFCNGSARVEAKENVTSQVATEATLAALAELQQRLGTNRPHCYLVSDNLGAPEAVRVCLGARLTNAPWAGLANNWGDYLPIDRDTLGNAVTKERGIVITAVTGDVDAELEMEEGLTKKHVSYDLPKDEWRRRWDEQGPTHAARGEALVRKFHFTGTRQATNVLIITGTMHTPRQEYVFAGARRALPPGVVLIGGSGADFSSVYFQGQCFNHALLGLRLSGAFQVVATGSKGRGDQLKTSLPAYLKALTQRLHGAQPSALIYFGCAGWRAALPEQQQILQQYLPPQAGIYGQFCGGEFGQLQDAPDLVADTDLGLLVLMAPAQTLIPSIK